MVLGKLELLLPKVDRAQTIPGVIVAWIGTNSVSVAVHRLFKIFVRNVLVTGERVRVCERRVQLNSLAWKRPQAESNGEDNSANKQLSWTNLPAGRKSRRQRVLSAS